MFNEWSSQKMKIWLNFVFFEKNTYNTRKYYEKIQGKRKEKI